MGLLQVNFARDAQTDEAEIYAVPTELVSSIQPSSENPKHESYVSFREDITGRYGNGVYVKNDFDSVCEAFNNAVNGIRIADWRKITQKLSFTKNPST